MNEYYIPRHPDLAQGVRSAVVEVTIPSGQETWIDEAAASLGGLPPS